MLRVMDHFEYQRAHSDDLARERRKWFIAAKDQQERKQLAEDRADDALTDFAVSTILATSAEVAAFEVKLNAYDEAAVKALMQNQQALDAVNLEIQDILSKAHKLDDGRKVFKTEDGTKVFDQHGAEIGDDIIPPEAISDNRPTWESYSGKIEAREQLQQERDALHEYQEKLDDAREATQSGELTKEELDDMDAELEDSMPPSVSKHLPEDLRPDSSQAPVDLKSNYDASASPVSQVVSNTVEISRAASFTPSN